MSDERVFMFDDGTVTPVPGWQWCPSCNGEGSIATMQASPDMPEHVSDCRRCEGSGLVQT